ncbi:arrestin domain-containing protein 17-like isoform X2 [Symsagittifera roscoffensis]|uniref:arrestin domain-containing protein 17-like isoform X2 n=1 Tax=Symsagittifera roscoffensis TaxID=84072 RepID=UPI00307BC206
MRIQKFVIVFDRANAVYRQGDTITGKVVLSLEKALKLKALRIQIVGEALVKWEYGVKKTPKQNSNHVFSSREEYFNYKQTLHGREEDDKKSKNVELGRGQYDFPFAYTLPSDTSLPTSLEGPYGYVRYFARAVIERPFSKNCFSIKPFTVLGVLDLNLDESSLVPANSSKVQGSKSCFCCKTANTVVTLGLNRTGYCPGELIKVSANCENNTSKKILRSSADLLQIVDYTGSQKQLIGTKTKTRRTLKTIQSVRGEGCASHSTLTWDNTPLAVPAIPPSKLEGCELISIRYLLRFTIFFKKNKRVCVETPVLVGTEPLRLTYPSYHEGMQPLSPPPIRLSADSEPSAPTAADLDLYDCPPPSYEACVYGGATLTEDEFTMGQTTFVPMYQVYNTLRSQTRSTAMSNRTSAIDPIPQPVSPAATVSTTAISRQQSQSHPVTEVSLNSTAVDVSYSENRFNPNDERYIYSTPNPHALRGEDSNSNANPSSTPSSAAVSPIGGDRPPFRASSSSSHHHSPQHEADDTEASHSVHVNGRRGSSDDNDSSGLPEDGMIPLSEEPDVQDDEREHPPPAPLHSGKYQNDYVAVENEIYMAYGQDQHHESSSEAPNTPSGGGRGGRLSESGRGSVFKQSPVSPNPPELLPRSTSQSSSGSKVNVPNVIHKQQITQEKKVHADNNFSSTTTTTTTHHYYSSSDYQQKVMGPTEDGAIMLVDADGSLGSDFNSDDQGMYLDEARA